MAGLLSSDHLSRIARPSSSLVAPAYASAPHLGSSSLSLRPPPRRRPRFPSRQTLSAAPPHGRGTVLAGSRPPRPAFSARRSSFGSSPFSSLSRLPCSAESFSSLSRYSSTRGGSLAGEPVLEFPDRLRLEIGHGLSFGCLGSRSHALRATASWAASSRTRPRSQRAEPRLVGGGGRPPSLASARCALRPCFRRGFAC
jgi:hypothetical protein